MVSNIGKHKIEIALLLAFILYGAWFIYRTSFFIGGKHYFCLFDDAMISMSYAKNLLNGYGLNWAKFGNPVEGYTHPLWVFFMVVTSLFVKSDSLRSLPIQLLSLFFLVLNLIYIRKLLVEHYTVSNKNYYLPAVILTAFYYPLVNWSLQGMESGFQSFLIVSSLYYFYNFYTGKYYDLIKLSILLSLSLLLRMDMVLFVSLLAVYCAFIIVKNNKKINLKYILISLGIVVIPNILYLGFRFLYFKDFLPNTYYLKMYGYPTIPRIMRGLSVFIDFLRPLFVPLLLILAYISKNIRRLHIQIPFFVTVIYFAYSIYVGGDAWEDYSIGANRFEVIVIPLIFILLSSFLYDLYLWLDSIRKPFKIKEDLLVNLNFYLTFLISAWFFITFNGLADSAKWKEKWQNLTVLNPPLYVLYNKDAVLRTLEMNRRTDKNAVVAVVGAGIPGFFGKFKLADVLGYSDSYIAKKRVPLEYTEINYLSILPGHMKFDYEYLMKELKVDVFMGICCTSDPVVSEQFYTLVSKYGYVYKDYWVKEGTAHYFNQ